MLLAAWRLLSRPDLDDDDAPPRADGRGWLAEGRRRRCVTSPSSASSSRCSRSALKRPFLFVLAYVYVDIVSPQRLSYYLLNSIPISLIVAGARDRRLAARRQEGRLASAPRQGLIADPARLRRPHHRSTPTSRSRRWSKWDWVWKALLSPSSCRSRCAPSCGSRPPAVPDPVGRGDHHRRRHQDGAVGRRLRRAQPDGRQQ